MLKPDKRIRAEELFFLALTRAGSIVVRLAESALASADITVAEYTMLRVIENRPGITAAQARAHLRTTAPTMALLIKELLRHGFIVRTSDMKDARRLPLTLTTKGRAALRRAKKEVERTIRRTRVPASLLESMTKQLLSFLSSLPSHGTR